MNKIGSSETIRKTTFNFTNVPQRIVSHKSFIKNSFLEWFIGFSEGDGSFIVSNKRLFFIINQKEEKILHYIRANLGFGKVSKYLSYSRYIVADRNCVDKLISIFNGNLVLYKTNARFALWLIARNQYSQEKLCYRGVNQFVGFHNNGWLSGFTDAEGGFYVSLCEDKKRKCTKLSFKYSIKQKGERDVLEKILILIRNLKDIEDNTTTFKTLKKGIYNVKGKKDTYALEVTKKTDLLFLTNYFDNYLLLSRNKRLVYVRWKRVLLRVRPYQKDTKAYKRYKRLVASVGKVRL